MGKLFPDILVLHIWGERDYSLRFLLPIGYAEIATRQCSVLHVVTDCT